MKQAASLALGAVAALWLTGCAASTFHPVSLPGGSQGGAWQWPEQALTIALPPGQWLARKSDDQAFVEFRRQGQPGRLALQVTALKRSHGGKPAPTAVLRRALLIELPEKEVLGTWPMELPGLAEGPAECLLARARLQGKTVIIKACVFARAGKVYDALCWAPAEDFLTLEPFFDPFLRGLSAAEADQRGTPP